MKIITRMMGGLGNQLFILAYACKLAKDYGKDDYEIVLDLREYDTYKIRQFELSDLLIDNRIRIYTPNDKNGLYDISRKIYHLLQFLFRTEKWKDKMLESLSKHSLYYSGLNVGKYEIPSKKKDIYVYGYFQSAKMVFDVKQIIINMLSISRLRTKLIEEKKYISVSVRCGQDYLNGGWKVYDGAYYRKGIKKILKEKEYDNFGVIVFSDDIDKAKNMNIWNDAIYIENKSPVEQLAYMYKCSDYIISNSSFSWWGAALGMDNDSIVIAPSIWYHSSVKTIDTELYFDHMIIMD